MPTRTAFVITIGDVIESGPPQTRSAASEQQLGKNQFNGNTFGNQEAAAGEPESSDDEFVNHQQRPRKKMKTRHISASSNSSLTNGNSCPQAFASTSNSSGSGRPRRAASTKSYHDEDEDEEVSFSDSAFEVNGIGGVVGSGYPPGPACSKKKRKSVTEKFLEDNEGYYGIQVRPKSRLSDGDLENSKTNGARSRSCSANSTSVISGKWHPDIEEKKLRVNVKKIDEKSLQAALSGCSSGQEDEDEGDAAKRQTRKPAAISPSIDNNNAKKRRSELDKLLEAGSSSFHFETARQTAKRLSNELGPIHVNVKSETETSDEEVAEKRPMPASKKAKRAALLKKATPSPKWGGRSRKTPEQKSPRKSQPHDSEEGGEDSDPSSDDVRRGLEEELARVDGEEVPTESFMFSFERTPLRESWYQTYTRQDQGDELLYYPEPKSFPLPYEMPISTFYPRKDPNKDGAASKSVKGSKFNSPRGSGTATPLDPVKTTRGSQAAALMASKKLQEQVSTSRKGKGRNGTGPGVLTAQGLADRKSPRCHASTKSLISAMSEDFEVLDDYSNDSVASSPTKKKVPPVQETPEDFKEISLQMDRFFHEPDPLLDCDTGKSKSPISPPTAGSKRRSSSSERSHKRSKSSRKAKGFKSDHMDYVVAANIDQVLLDCLEDELPSVPIPSEMPGSAPLDLIQTFGACTSMRTGGRLRGAKVTKPAVSSEGRVSFPPSRKSSLATNSDEEDEDRSSTILKRLLSKGKGTQAKPVVDYSSSEETASLCSSTTSSTSSTSRKKRRKRNPTGFPLPKKRKQVGKSPKLLTTVLKQNAAKNAFAKGRVEQAKKVMVQKAKNQAVVVKVPLKKNLSGKKTTPPRKVKANLRKRHRGTLRMVPQKNYDEDMDAEDEDDDFIRPPMPVKKKDSEDSEVEEVKRKRVRPIKIVKTRVGRSAMVRGRKKPGVVNGTNSDSDIEEIAVVIKTRPKGGKLRKAVRSEAKKVSRRK